MSAVHIAVVAPSGAFDPVRFAAGVDLAREAGLTLDVPDDLLQPHRYLAAPDEVRLTHLVDALTNPDVAAVWAARGGFGVTRLLDRIPWGRVQPKPVVGFSDLTPLIDAMRVKVGAVGLHGPVIHSLPGTTRLHRERLFASLRGDALAPLKGTPWVSGRVSGPIVGGNLSMIAATCGTPWQLDARGALLLLEDVGEPPYRIDRLLTQLRQAGVFRGVHGVLVGTWESCRVPDGSVWALEDILREHLVGLDVPVLGDLPIGHGADNAVVPIGGWATLDDDTLSFGRAPTAAG